MRQRMWGGEEACGLSYVRTTTGMKAAHTVKADSGLTASSRLTVHTAGCKRAPDL